MLALGFKDCTPRSLSLCQGGRVVEGAVFGGFLRALHSLTDRGRSLISGNAHLPAEVIWNQAQTLPLSAVLFLSSQFPFLYLSPGFSPEIISVRIRRPRSWQRLLFLYSELFAPVFLGNATVLMCLVPRSCGRWALVTGMFLKNS